MNFATIILFLPTPTTHDIYPLPTTFSYTRFSHTSHYICCIWIVFQKITDTFENVCCNILNVKSNYLKCIASQCLSPPWVLFFLWNFDGRRTRVYQQTSLFPLSKSPNANSIWVSVFFLETTTFFSQWIKGEIRRISWSHIDSFLVQYWHTYGIYYSGRKPLNWKVDTK